MMRKPVQHNTVSKRVNEGFLMEIMVRKKIDIHSHATAFPDYVPKRKNDSHRFLCMEEQLEIYDKLDVEMGVLLPIIAPECQWMLMSNEEAKFISDKRPDRFVWFCNVDPRQGKYNAKSDLDYIINHYKALGAKGLGELTTPMDADDPMMDNLFNACERAELPVLIHIAPQHGNDYGIVDQPGLPRTEKMLKKYPDMKMIGHSAAFWCEISDYPLELRNSYPNMKIVKEGRLQKLLRECPNLYCDISAGSGANAFMRDPEYAAKFVEEFADRIFYGTDVCATNNTFQYKFDAFLNQMVNDGMISQANYEKIIRWNAVKLLGLEK